MFGVPEAANEKTEEVICNVFQDKLNVSVSTDMIDRCHRTGRKQPSANNSSASANSKPRPRPIIIKFTSYKHRSLVLQNRKHLRGTNISIKEDLTKSRLELLQLASKKFGFKNVWSKDGIIFSNFGGTIKKVTHLDLLTVN